MSFKLFNLCPELLEGITAMGYEVPTPIQEEAIPLILQNRDLIGCAQTGTGKTAAFVIPLIHKFSSRNDNYIKCIVLCPTRELAMQTDQHITGLGYYANVTSCPVYGGNQPELFNTQKRAIESGVDIIVATPGRLIAHLNLGYLDLRNVNVLVLDEADRMLDMGFYHDIMKIINQVPKERQTLLFSATMPPTIRKLSNAVLQNPEHINIAIAKPVESINQIAYLIFDDKKIKLLEYVIKEREVQNMIIFASRKTSVKAIESKLNQLGHQVKSMHSDKTQEERNEIMRQFKAGNIKILVATDILSRGIDIEGLSHVLNYDIPHDAEDYVHRIGRTARADKKGEAISFINGEDQRYFKNIERLIEREITKTKTPEHIGNSPSHRHSSGKSSRKKWHRNPRKRK